MSKKNSGGRPTTEMKAELEAADFTHEDLDFNMLKIDPELKEELEAQNLAYRWINAPTYLKGGNFHRSGWRAYKRKKPATGAVDFNLGTSGDDFIIRNDLILAVKPKEQQERWKAMVKRRTDLQSGSDSSRADELRAAARAQGVKAKILEGYDENDPDKS